MKKGFLIFIACFMFSNSWACGGWDGMYTEEYYRFFDQKIPSIQGWEPFFYNPDERFNTPAYESEDDFWKHNQRGSIKLWQEIIPNKSKSEVESIVFNENQSQTLKELVDKEIIDYLHFTWETNKFLSYRSNGSYSWNYEQESIPSEKEFRDRIALAHEYLEGAKIKQLKQRYVYQILRLFHYMRNYDEAISFWNMASMKYFKQKNELYYYCLDQVAGCYYSTERKEKAAYLFTKVFNNSIDRKISAYNSYDFCVNTGKTGETLVKNKEDELDFMTIKSIFSLDPNARNIKKILELSEDDVRAKLLFSRYLGFIESDYFNRNQKLTGFSDNQFYSELMNWLPEFIAKSKKKNKRFWRVGLSYIYFLNKDYDQALAVIKNSEKTEFTKRLKILIEVYSWTEMNSSNERKAYKFLRELTKGKGAEENSVSISAIKDRISHLYYKEGDFAQSFLLHKHEYTFNENHSIELLNALESYFLKPNKSELEEEFILKKNSITLERVNFKKAIYWLLQSDLNKALEYFQKSNKSDIQNIRIPKIIFSNALKHCFNCEAQETLDDRVYESSTFNFIPPSMDWIRFTETLIQLQDMATKTKGWQAKLANYLLANYYFNVSEFGYYRGLLVFQQANNCCWSYFNIDRNIPDEMANQTYSMHSFYQQNLFHNLSEVANSYYDKTIALSKDDELIARCYFLKARIVNSEKSGSNDILLNPNTKNKESKVYLPDDNYFDVLNEKYQHTKFYKKAYQSCSYLRMYTNTVR
jgi:hypothetical protein